MSKQGSSTRTIVITPSGHRALLLMKIGIEFGDEPPYPDEPGWHGGARPGPRDPEMAQRAADARKIAQSQPES